MMRVTAIPLSAENYVAMRGPGQVEIGRNTTGTEVFILGTRYNNGVTEQNFSVLADGSATFAGTCEANASTNTVVQANAPAFKGNAVSTDASQACFVARQYTSSGYTFNGTDSSGLTTFNVTDAGIVTASNVTFNLEADDDTKYTSTTDSEGEVTLVYNGTTLDVKDRIQNVLARMDAIEANEITDDATDSALLTLIANLSARLDERDTQIAALTARVSTLES